MQATNYADGMSTSPTRVTNPFKSKNVQYVGHGAPVGYAMNSYEANNTNQDASASSASARHRRPPLDTMPSSLSNTICIAPNKERYRFLKCL